MEIIEEIFPELYNSFIEVEFIIRGTTLWYYGQGEYRIDRPGPENLSIEIHSNIDLDIAKNKVLLFLKNELTKISKRIVEPKVFPAWCKILCKRKSTKSGNGAMKSAQAAG